MPWSAIPFQDYDPQLGVASAADWLVRPLIHLVLHDTDDGAHTDIYCSDLPLTASADLELYCDGQLCTFFSHSSPYAASSHSVFLCCQDVNSIFRPFSIIEENLWNAAVVYAFEPYYEAGMEVT